MSAGVAADSVTALYRAMNGALAGYLGEHFGVAVHYEPLSDLQGYLVTSPRPGAPKVLVLGEHLTEVEKVYLCTHTAAHLLLGHAGRPFATILEPRRTRGGPSLRLDDWQVRQEQHADLLTGAILWGSEQGAGEALGRYAGAPPDAAYRQIAPGMARTLSRLLVGHRHRAWKLALDTGPTRKAIRHGLRLARAAYHRSGVRHALAAEPVVRDLREVYCLTELVTMTPEPLLAGPHAAAAADAEITWAARRPRSTTWRDIRETTSWRDATREDPSLRN